jgi:predicted acyltransferase
MPRRPTRARFPSLDLLIGILAVVTLAGDYPGRWHAGYGPFGHAEWDGIRVFDLLCPVFLFLLGASVPLRQGVSSAVSIAWRVLAVIAIGVGISGYPRFDLATWRFPGVLQRAGVGYLVGSTVFLATTGDSRRRGAIVVSAAAFLTLAYWLILVHVPVPGGTAGDLSPEGSLAKWIDQAVFGAHLWSLDWDPDGLPSTISSISTVLFGVAAGLCVDSSDPPRRKVAQLAGAGAGAIVAGLLWSAMIPINRTLWSSSFMVCSAGVSSVVLALWLWMVNRGARGTRR